MATPNLTSPGLSIIPNVSTIAITTTSKIGIITNSSSSNKVYKINVVRASNIGSTQVDVSLGMTGTSAGVGLTFYVLRNCVVPPQTSLLIISKDSYQYLKEGDTLHIEASAADRLHVIASWEEIS